MKNFIIGFAFMAVIVAVCAGYIIAIKYTQHAYGDLAGAFATCLLTSFIFGILFYLSND